MSRIPPPTRTSAPFHHPGSHSAGDPEHAFQPGFTVGDAFIVLFASVVAQFVAAAVLAGFGATGTRAIIAATLAAQSLAIAAVFAWLTARGRALWPVLGPVRPRGRHAALGVGFGIIGFLLVQVVGAMVGQLVPEAPPPDQFLLDVLGSDLFVTVGVLLAAVVLAPLQEELIYRAMFFQSIRARIGLPGALVGSSLVFAAAHVEVWGSPVAIIGLIALALWLAAVFHQTGSLVVPIVAHATYNAITIGLTLFLPPELLGLDPDAAAVAALAPLAAVAAGIG